MTDFVYLLLSDLMKISPHGPYPWARSLFETLVRSKGWISWKQESCSQYLQLLYWNEALEFLDSFLQVSEKYQPIIFLHLLAILKCDSHSRITKNIWMMFIIIFQCYLVVDKHSSSCPNFFHGISCYSQRPFYILSV